MNLEEVKQFINQVGWGYFATTDGRIVGVRPMAGLVWKDNNFLCATFSVSDKVSQLRKVPYGEYCFCDTTGRHVRLAGPCKISTDNAEKLWFYNQVPRLKEYIPDPASPAYVVIKMSPDNIRVMDPADRKYEQVKLK
jgi:uncharacterized pyridoxamine 5'-phosphate oxidase family protein